MKTVAKDKPAPTLIMLLRLGNAEAPVAVTDNRTQEDVERKVRFRRERKRNRNKKQNKKQQTESA